MLIYRVEQVEDTGFLQHSELQLTTGEAADCSNPILPAEKKNIIILRNFTHLENLERSVTSFIEKQNFKIGTKSE